MDSNDDEFTNNYISFISRKYIKTYYRSFDWREFACGCGSAFVNIGVTYPLYKLIFRQMLHGVRFKSAFYQLKHEGIFYLYRGILPPLAQKTIAISIMFGVYNGTRNYALQSLNFSSPASKIIAGLVSGSTEAILLPLERVQALLANAKYYQIFNNTPQAFKYVLYHYGIKELYRGIMPVLLRNGPSNVMFFMLRDTLAENRLTEVNNSARRFEEFLTGAVIGASCSTIFYPLNVIKVVMQSDLGHKSETILETTRKIYNERKGIRYFFSGCGLNTSRSFLSWGIVNVTYEYCKTCLNKYV